MRVMIVTTALVLAACGPVGGGPEQDETGSLTAPAPVPDAGTTAPFSADVSLPIDETTPGSMVFGDGLQATYVAETGLVISGSNDEGKSSGKTSGATFVIRGDAEARISGNDIQVKIRASGPEGTSMDVAYSTREVGNSGWQAFTLTPDIQEYTFSYDVPQMVEGRGDYIGIVPKGGEVTVTAIGVDITGRSAQPAEASGNAEAETP